MLTDVEGSGSSSVSSAAASRYLLKGDSSVNLSAHLNLQITGSVDKSAAHSSATSLSGQPSTAPPGTPNPTDPPSDTPAASANGASRAHDMGAMKPATLKVASVTMVSATCS